MVTDVHGCHTALALCFAKKHVIPKESSFDCGVELEYREDNSKFVQVLIDAARVPLEPNDGFGWAGKTLVLHGASCSLLNDRMGHELYVQMVIAKESLCNDHQSQALTITPIGWLPVASTPTPPGSS